MPFTFSHPAIVLPLTYFPKKWFSLTGLVIGSLTPDFEYFLRMKIKSIYSHTIEGIFWFDLPLGIFLAFIFHNIVRNSLFDNLSFFFKSRFSAFEEFNWNNHFKKNWLIIIISIIIGGISHIFWDSFTHHSGYFVQEFPTLSTTISIANKQILILKTLQHSSTLLGGIVIAHTIYKLPKKENVNERSNPKYWPILAGLTLVFISIRFLNGLEIKQYGSLIATSISSILISLTLTPFLIAKKSYTRSNF